LCTLKEAETNFLETLREAKRIGFSDKQIAICRGTDEFKIRKLRKEANIIPAIKQIDTLAAEWPAKTNYLYLTYGGDENDIQFSSGKKKVMVLGAGVFRIGSSVEFDWCGVNTIWALKKNGIEEAIMVNYNPETVSTDYDMSDKLYFEELTLERILDIYDKEQPFGVIASVGGQIPNNLALKLSNAGVNLLGTSGESIDKAEDRAKFSALLDKLEIPQPEWRDLSTTRDLKKFASKVGYPVLIRPSYVLSGSAMRVAYNKEELEDYLKLAAKVSREHPAVISKFIENATEVEVDGVYDGEDNIIGAIIEHVENAGVHSGDATMMIGSPLLTLDSDVLRTVQDYTHKIVEALEIRGPYNIQYLVKNGTTYVIECNLRASRSMPYVSKTRGVNMIELATLAMLGKNFKDAGFVDLPEIRHVGVKVPQFSFMRLSGADPVLGVEMLSTGEVACLGENFTDALSKALQSAEFKIPPEGGSVLITVGGKELKKQVVPLGRALRKMGFKIYATQHTAEALQDAGVNNITVLHKVREVGQKPNIVDYLQEAEIDLVINIPMPNHLVTFSEVLKDEYTIRRLAVEFNVPVVTNLQLASALTKLLEQREANKFDIRSLNEYMDSLPRKFW
jgi:carbamoyl-phosphate synthase large subunit